MTTDVMNESIEVFLRQRPLDEDEERSLTFLTPTDLPMSRCCLSLLKDSVTRENGQEYSFTGVLEEDIRQQEVYVKCASRVVSATADGYNGTILAYGQSGSGKTWTMRGNPRDLGLVPRALEDLFLRQKRQKEELGVDMTFSVSYVEIYCECLTDLLDPTERKNLSIHEKSAHEGGGVYVENLARIPIYSAEEALELLERGDSQRFTAATRANDRSSRSHACVLIHIERTIHQNKRCSTLTLVDLAGSERSSGVAHLPQRLEECKYINLSLAALGNCVSALAQKRPHVPFRDSKLTRLLQNSLGGCAKTTFIATINGSASGETKSTLDFAARAMRVQVKARPQELTIDYAALYRSARAQLDAKEESERRRDLDQMEKHKENADKDQLLEEAQRLNDTLERQLRAQKNERIVGGFEGSDAVEAIEALHERYARDRASMEDRQAAEVVAQKAKSDDRVRAYRAAANSATENFDRAQEELGAERTQHLESLRALRSARDTATNSDKDHAARLSELLVEVNELREQKAELQRQLQTATHAAAETSRALNTRVANLERATESDQSKIQTDFVSRQKVTEMEALFQATVDKLTTRLAHLEDKHTKALASGQQRHHLSKGARTLLDSIDEPRHTRNNKHHNITTTQKKKNLLFPEINQDDHSSDDASTDYPPPAIPRRTIQQPYAQQQRPLALGNNSRRGAVFY